MQRLAPSHLSSGHRHSGIFFYLCTDAAVVSERPLLNAVSTSRPVMSEHVNSTDFLQLLLVLCFASDGRIQSRRIPSVCVCVCVCKTNMSVYVRESLRGALLPLCFSGLKEGSSGSGEQREGATSAAQDAVWDFGLVSFARAVSFDM